MTFQLLLICLALLIGLAVLIAVEPD